VPTKFETFDETGMFAIDQAGSNVVPAANLEPLELTILETSISEKKVGTQNDFTILFNLPIETKAAD